MIGKLADPFEGEFEVIYQDGSCFECEESLSGGWTDAAFTSDPTLVTTMTNLGYSGPPDALIEYGVDGLRRRLVLSGVVSDPVWSSRGELALVRRGSIWAGSPQKLHRVTRGAAVSWSPDGRHIVFVRGGWLRAGAVRGRSFRRLVRGANPAWSPDGRAIAFLDKHHRLSVVSATGGRVRRVGGVTGVTVDWQPLPATPPAPCLTPPGSTVVARSSTATISESYGQTTNYPYAPASAYMGCLGANGREELLSSGQTSGYSTGVGATQVVLTAPYVAFAGTGLNGHDQTMVSGVSVFDLRTGLGVPDRGGEQSMCVYQSVPPCATSVDHVVLGSDGVSAAHMTVQDNSCGPVAQPNCHYTVEQIQASDSMGVRTLDGVIEPDGSPAELTDLALSGDTLTWEHNGTPRSAQLEP